jgi:lysophospholipase L1-like esterase
MIYELIFSFYFQDVYSLRKFSTGLPKIVFFVSMTKTYRKKIRKTIGYILYLTFVVALCLELLLRIYNPFHFRIKGQNIVLETNKTYYIDNSANPRLDKSIVHTINGMGFRGPERPPDFDSVLSIVTIGGSTTECAYINDGKTWTDAIYNRLKQNFPALWMNNAGLAGHSTFGHIALVKDFIRKIRPNFVLFLVGVNDMRRNDLTDSDKSNMTGYYRTVLTFISRHSELCNTIVNLFRTREARKRTLVDRNIDLTKEGKDTLVLNESYTNTYLIADEQYLPAYRNRLQTLVDLCRQQHIRPVLVTQPALVGEGRDPLTNASLENLRVGENVNGKLWWLSLEKYNDVARAVAAENDVPLIDLAREMPKSSLYFYDLVHFTNRGCDEVGSIISRALLPVLHEHPRE